MAILKTCCLKSGSSARAMIRSGWPHHVTIDLYRSIVCPPHINFAAYNHVKSEKHYIVYPGVGHWVPEDFYIRRMDFISEKFGSK